MANSTYNLKSLLLIVTGFLTGLLFKWLNCCNMKKAAHGKEVDYQERQNSICQNFIKFKFVTYVYLSQKISWSI